MTIPEVLTTIKLRVVEARKSGRRWVKAAARTTDKTTYDRLVVYAAVEGAIAEKLLDLHDAIEYAHNEDLAGDVWVSPWGLIKLEPSRN